MDGMEEEAFLEDTWCLFHHGVHDADWTLHSYTRLRTISSAEDFWSASAQVAEYLDKDMFFVMREHVFPCWDDPHNIDGGCVCARVPMARAAEFWEHLCARTLCEALCADAHAVNGVSTSPKNRWCVFKVWVSRAVPPEALDLPQGHEQGLLYRANRDMIQQDQP